MLRPASMKKINAVVLWDKKDDVLRRLEARRIIQFSTLSEPLKLEVAAPTGIGARANELISQIDRILDIFNSVGFGVKSSPMGDMFGSSIERIKMPDYSPEALFQEVRDKFYVIRETVINIPSRIEAIHKEREELLRVREILQLLQKLNVGPGDLAEYKYVNVLVGTVPTHESSSLKQDLDEFLKHFFSAQEPLEGGKSAILLGFPRGLEIEASRVLRVHHFEELHVPAGYNVGISEALKKVEEELAALEKEEEHLSKEVVEIARKENLNLLRLRELLEIEKFLDDSNHLLGKTKNTYILSGWVPAERANDAVEEIKRASGGNCIISVDDPEEGEEPPTLLANPTPTRPMELLTYTYGAPNYREVDPTSFMALTFPLIFGLMFGDVGQGVLVAFTGYLLGYKLKTQGGVRELGRILVLCGIAAFFAGFLYGSIFGLEGEHARRYLGFELHPLWLSPTENPGALIGFGMKLGVALLIMACALNIVNEVSHKKYIDALVSPYGVAGIWLLIGATLVISKHSTDILGLVTDLAVIPAIIGPFGLMTVGEWYATKISLPMSVFEAFENMSRYLVNSISFVRVIALAIIHGALNLIMTLIMDTVGGGIPAVIVFIIGNIGIFVMEMFVSFVQTMRLHYYEWFSKFFSADGKKFKPFGVKREYTLGGE